jgi:RNA polymerase sigma factor (sigma-70 family)
MNTRLLVRIAMTPATLRNRLSTLALDPDGLSDADLLGRFADDNDPDAFAALVRRHGPVVLAVCRRVLAHGPDAEDAFQAAFLVLARKAASVRGRVALPAWLHRVTLRVARRALFRRRPAEALGTDPRDPADPFAEVAWKDVRRVLDEELDRLPEKYRGPVVLCFLDGCTRDEAAGRLRCSLNTLKRRLDTGRELLRARLLRRGVAPAALAAAALDPAGLRSAVPPPLLTAAVRTADRSSSIPPGVASLAATTTASRLCAGAVATVLVLGAVAGLLATSRPDVRLAAAPSAAANPAAAPDPADHDALPPGAVCRFGDDRFRHPGHVINSAMSPDGKRLATFSTQLLQIMDAETGRPLRRVRLDLETGHFSTPDIVFSPDGKYLAAALAPELTAVWDVATGQVILKLTDSERWWGRCAFTPDGKLAVTHTDRTPLLELPTGKEVGSWPVGGLHLLTKDTKTYAKVVKERESVVLGDTATGKVTHRLEVSTAMDGFENGLAVSPDGGKLAVVHDRREVQVWDVVRGEKLRALSLDENAILKNDVYYQLAFSRDGRVLMFGSKGGAVYRWDVAMGNKLPDLRVPWGWYVRRMETSPDGRILTVTEGNGGVFRWDPSTGQRVGPMPGYHAELRLAVSADGRSVLLGDRAGRIDAWDPETGKILRQLSPPRDMGSALDALAVSPDGRRVAFGEGGGEVRLVHPDGTNERVLRSDPKNPGVMIRWVQFTPDGRRICAAEYGRGVRVWDPDTGRLLWSAPDAPVGAVSPDGKRLAVTRRNDLTVADIETGTVIRAQRLGIGETGNLDAVRALAFAPDGRLACAIHDGDVLVLDPTGVELIRFKATSQRPVGRHDWRFGGPSYPPVTTMAFSSDGKWLLTGGEDRSVRVWEVATGQRVEKFDGHLAGVSTVAFTPDDRSALSAGHDGYAYRWDLRPPTAGLTEAPVELWRTAASVQDAAAAFRAAWALVATTAERRRALAELLPPVKTDFTAAQVKGWVADLSSETFTTREAATKALAARARLIEPALREAARGASDPEARKRLVGVLNSLHAGPTPEELRVARVVRAAEMAGITEARELLNAWAGGTAKATLTEDAKAALARLAAGAAPGPRHE